MSKQGKTNYVTQQQLKTIRRGRGVGHIHNNKDTLDAITPEKLDLWDDAADQAHSHNNRDAIDLFFYDEDTNTVYLGNSDNLVNFAAYGEVAAGGVGSDTPAPGATTLGGLLNVVDAADDIHSVDKILVRLANASGGNSWTLANLSDISGTVVGVKINGTVKNPGTDKIVDLGAGYATENWVSGNYLAATLKGASNGLAELGSDGKVPSSQLPSYVDDVLDFSSKSAIPATGESGKIYVALDTNLTYRWSGTTYVEISPSLALGETESTAYRGDRGKIAYDHSQLSGNPHNTTWAQVALASGNAKILTDYIGDGQVTIAKLESALAWLSHCHYSNGTLVLGDENNAINFAAWGEVTAGGVGSGGGGGAANLYQLEDVTDYRSSAYYGKYLRVKADGSGTEWVDVTGGVSSVINLTGDISRAQLRTALGLGSLAYLNGLSTSDVSEGTNLYFTNARATAACDGRYLRWNGNAADVSAMTWGTLTAANGYTILSHASSSDGGDMGLCYKGGQIFMQVDGYFYQNEGQYRCLDTSDSGGYSLITSGNIGSQSVAYATSAGNADTLDSLHASSFAQWKTYSSPDVMYDFGWGKMSAGSGSPTGTHYGQFLTIPYRKATGNTAPDFAWQIFGPNGNEATNPDDIFVRTSLSTSWRTWHKLYHSGNANSSNIPWNAAYLRSYGGLHIERTNFARNYDEGLRIVGSASQWCVVMLGCASGVYSGYQDTQWGLCKTDTDTFRINRGPSGNSFMEILNNGNVGIGTASPSYKLDVNGSFNATSGYINGNTIYHSGNCNNASTPWSCSFLLAEGTGSYNNKEGLSSKGRAYIGQNTNGTAIIDAFDGFARFGCDDYGNGSYGAYIAIQGWGGRVGVGTTSPSEKLHIAGNVLAAGEITAGSDSRWKDNQTPVTNGIDIIRLLRPMTWTWNEQFADKNYIGKQSAGLIAQQVASVLPFAVRGNEENGFTLDYNVFHAYEISAIQSHETRIERLERENRELKMEIQRLRS